jgi:hypothetical protein
MLEDLDLKIGDANGGSVKPLTDTQFQTQPGCCATNAICTKTCTQVKFGCTSYCN